MGNPNSDGNESGTIDRYYERPNEMEKLKKNEGKEVPIKQIIMSRTKRGWPEKKEPNTRAKKDIVWLNLPEYQYI